jgi:hypothetical protein
MNKTSKPKYEKPAILPMSELAKAYGASCPNNGKTYNAPSSCVTGLDVAP